MNKKLKYLLIGLAIFIAILLILLRVPALQTGIAGIVVNVIEKQTGTVIKLDKVAINFIDNVSLKGIYLEDEVQDTLVYASELNVDIGIFKLLKGEIILEDIFLLDPVINISQNDSGNFNFQFLIDLFTSEDTTVKSESSIKLEIGTVKFQNADLSIGLIDAQNDILFNELEIAVNELDLDSLVFDFDEITLKNAEIQSIWKESIPEVDSVIIDDSKILFPLAGLPVTILADNINILETNVLYKKGTASNSNSFDANFIKLNDLNLELEDLTVSDKEVLAEIKTLNGLFNEKIQINRSEARLAFKEKGIVVKSFVLESDRTTADFSAELSYSEFEELANFSDKLKVKGDFKKLVLSLNDLSYFVPDLSKIEQLKNNLNEQIELSGLVNGTIANLSINNLALKVSKTNLNFSGKLKNVIDYENMAFDNINIDLKTKVADLQKFIGSEYIKKDYYRFGNINLKTNFFGSLKNLQFDNLAVNTSGKLKLQLKGVVQNLLDSDKLSYNVNIQNVETSIADIKAIQKDLPEILNNFEIISYKGLLAGNKFDYKLKGNLYTNLGNLYSDLKLEFNKEFNNANYQGDLNLDAFDLGNLLNNADLGTVSMKATVNGAGLSIDDLNTQLKAEISSFSFRKYEYKNLEINGSFDKQKFDGTAGITDENLDFNFEGLLDFNDSIPIMKFAANLNKFDGEKLNLLDFSLRAKLNIDANIKGLNIEDVIGSVNIRNVYLENETQKWSTDSIVFLADITDAQKRVLKLESQILNIDVSGNYTIDNLPKVLFAFGDNFFPFSKLLRSDSIQNLPQINNELVDVKINVGNVVPIANLFNIKLQKLDTALLSFTLDAPNKLADFDFFIPEIIYNDIYIDSIYVTAKTNNNTLNAQLKIDSIAYKELAYVPNFLFKADFFEQKAVLNTLIKSNEQKANLNISADLKSELNGLEILFKDPIVLNKKEWKLVNNEPISLSNKEPVSYDFKMTNANEAMALGFKEEQFYLNFEKFKLSNFINLIEFDSADIKGLIDGKLTLENNSNLKLNTDFTIGNIRVNKLNFGDLNLKANILDDILNSNLNLNGVENSLKAEVIYNLESSELDGDLNIEKFSLKSMAPLVNTYASNLSGDIFGSIKFSFQNSEQIIDGALNFDKATAFIKPLGTQYEINSGNIVVTKNQFKPDLVLNDADKRKATLKGSVTHENFSNFQFDVNLSSDNFTFLNAKQNNESLFYGKLIANTNINIKGNPGLPIINGFLTARTGSDIVIQLISPKMAASQENYVVFVDGKDLSFEEIEELAIKRYQSDFNLDLNLIINIDETTNLNLLIDPLTGDNLALNGTAKLIVKMPPNGNIDIKGAYTVSSGSYRFSFQQILRRKFEIVKGSSINFLGNPLLAALNLQAAYKTDLSALPLVSNESATISDDDKKALKRKSEMKVLLKIKGKIEEPELSFDIIQNENNDSPLGSSISRALNRIRQNESDLNKQVFSILLFNSFTGTSSSGNISSAGTSSAARSVGNLINTQLNKLTNNVNGLQLNFDLDQYESIASENGEQTTEIDIGLSQSLLNDRLTISLDGNIGLETGNESNNAFSSIAGDFVLAYNITKDGKYKVRAFQQSDFDALNNSNVWKTGFGFSYEAKFGKVKK